MQKVKEDGYRRILLDTPSVAEASHRFYEKSGFVRISKSDLPFRYEYADRNSLLYLLEIH
jgi:RimJ/RimL family protein N-acetyltransferase